MVKLPLVIGRYVLEGQIASGGMATVYYGRRVDENQFAKPVAIKRMHPHCARDADFVAMFLDEANLAARIRHPNVVPVLDFAAEGEDLIIVMEYLAGDTVGSLIQSAHEAKLYPPHRVVAAIITDVLKGLHAAHEVLGQDGQPLHIVHRDVSPQNIMVGFDGVARVLDFGVAKASVRFQTTRAGQLKGRLQYMAPEQIRSRPVDRRADIYSTSVLYWEMIAGRPLFDADNAGSMMMMVLEGTVPSLRAVDPSVSPALEWLILKGLRADPTGRFHTALEMINAIEEAVGIAPAEEVADWVHRVAPASVRERVARISGAEVQHPIPAPLPAPGPVPSSSSQAVAPPPKPTPRPKTKKLFVYAFGATFVAAIIAFWFALHHVPWLGPSLISVSRTVFGDRFTAWIERVAHTADAGWAELQENDERPEAFWNLPANSATTVARFRPADMQPLISAPFARADGSWIPTETTSSPAVSFHTVLHLNGDHQDILARVVTIDRQNTKLVFAPARSARDGNEKTPADAATSPDDSWLLSIGLPTDSLGTGVDGAEISPALPNLCTLAELRDHSVHINLWPQLLPLMPRMSWWRQTASCLVLAGTNAPALDTHARERSAALGISDNTNTLFVVVGEKVDSDALARVMRYVGARFALQLDAPQRQVSVVMRKSEQRLEPLSPDPPTNPETNPPPAPTYDTFYVFRSDR